MRHAFAVQAEEGSPEFRQAAATPDVESSVERITAWIPTEVVGTYVALVGLFLPKSSGARWSLLVIGMVLVPVFVCVDGALVNKRGSSAWRARRQQGDAPKITTRQLWLCSLLAMLAFIAWAMALPSTPFVSWFANATKFGGGAVVVLALLLPKIGELLDLSLPQP